MSFSTWPMTLRQNRVDTFPDTPVGSDALPVGCQKSAGSCDLRR